MSGTNSTTEEPVRPAPDAIAPLRKAADLTWLRLFTPFDINKWLILAFAAFLINCNEQGGQPGGSCNFRLPGPTGGGPTPYPDFSDKMSAMISSPLFWAGVALLVLFIILIYALVLWLRCRADFTLIDMIGGDHTRFGSAWMEYAREGNQLFVLRAIVAAVPLIAGLPFAAFVLYSVFVNPDPMKLFVSPLFWGGLLIILLLMIPVWLIQFFIANFIVPIMYSRRCRVGQSAREGLGIITNNFGSVLLYLLIRFFLRIAGMILLPITGCVTVLLCGLGCIPGVGQYAVSLLTLPVWYGLTAYSMSFVEQFGYPMFPESPDATLPETSHRYTPLPPGALPPQAPPDE